MKRAVLSVLVMALTASAFAKGVEAEKGAVEYQYGTITALMAGDYQAKVHLKTVIKNGNNFGIGAGVGLGEVVAVDGEYFIADPYGALQKMKPVEGLSFLTATNFKPQKDLSFKVTSPIMSSDLQKRIDQKMKNNQLSYAILVKGEFTRLLVRSENYANPIDKPLVQWLKDNENRYTLKNISGKLVMFYSPSCTQGFGVPGYHTHVLSNDKKIGGHVLNGEIEHANVEIMPILDINLRPGAVRHQDHDVSLKELHKVENAEFE